MTWIRLIILGTVAALSSVTAFATDPPLGDAAASIPAVAKLPPVLRPTEPPDTRHVNLPGPRRVTPAIRLVPVILPVAKMSPLPAKLVPDPVLRQLLAMPMPAAAAPPVVKPAMAEPAPVPAVAATATPPPVPAELQKEIAVYCQKQIGRWKQPEALKILGVPTRHRPAYDEKQAVNGTIYAFADPSGRYRELELDFDKETGTLRSVFVYPLRLTWQQCRKLWDGPVTTADANRGRKFYSYSNRRLDVLVDPSGRVISLGWY